MTPAGTSTNSLRRFASTRSPIATTPATSNESRGPLSRTYHSTARFARFLGVLFLASLPLLTIDGHVSFATVGPGFALLLAVQLYPLIRQSSPDTFEPAAYHGLMGALGNLAIVASLAQTGELQFRFLPSLGVDDANALALTVIVASIVGQIAYLIGYYHPTWGCFWRRRFPAIAERPWNLTRLALVSTLIAVVFGSIYYVFQTRLGLGLFEPALALGKEVWSGDATNTWMIRGLQLGFIPLLFYVTLALTRSRTGPYLSIVATVFMGWLVLRTGQRGIAMLPIVAAAVVFHYLRHRIAPAIFAGALLFGTFTSNVSYQLRHADQVGLAAAVTSNPVAPMETLAIHEEERERFAVLGLIFHEFPQYHDYLMGESYLALISIPVPRWIWVNKHEYFPWRDNLIGHQLAGIANPTPYLGALYANFSYFGIVVGMLLLGVFHRGLYEWLRPHMRTPGVVLLYAVILVFFSPTMLGISSAVQYVVPILVTLFVIARRSANPSAFVARSAH